MRFRSTLILAFALVVTAMAADAMAAGPQKPEDLLKMRQGLMQAVLVQFGPIGAFAQGKGDLPADAADRAANLAALARIAPSAWPAGSGNLDHANTKPDAFGAKAAAFRDGWATLAGVSTTLAETIKAGNADAIKAQVGAVGKTCKGCHDDFRAE